jgi:hypothetical protein
MAEWFTARGLDADAEALFHRLVTEAGLDG